MPYLLAFQRTPIPQSKRAYDFFGDGSFYLLNSPSHTIAHLCALARVFNFPILLFPWARMCATILERILPVGLSSSLSDTSTFACCQSRKVGVPDRSFQAIQPYKSATKPFHIVQPVLAHDEVWAAWIVNGMAESDADDNFFVVTVHDEDMLTLADFLPKEPEDWREKEAV